MFKISPESKQKIQQIYLTLNQIEVKGMANFEKMYSCLFTLQEIMQEMDKLNGEGIVVSNPRKEDG